MPVYQWLCQYLFGRKIIPELSKCLQTVSDAYTVVTGWQEFLGD
jgi:cyclopropane fatty-acyl-phospholipid synthase-like methyltransferase